MKSAIGTGKNVDKAIADGLIKLGCTQDDVTIKVISEGGLFKKAEVELTLDVSIKEEASKPTPKAEPKKDAPKSEPKKEEKPAAEKAYTPKKAEPKTEQSKKTEVKRATGRTSGKNKEAIKQFLEQLISLSSARNAYVDVTEEDAHFKAIITGEALSSLIGSGGETLQAIETVLNIISAKNKDENKRVMLDVGAYKQNKINRLQEQADAAAKRVRDDGHEVRLKPMTNHERRIVHAYMQQQKDLKTFSRGEEPNRCIVIAKAENPIKDIKD